jgi:hypothetical protein
LYGGDGDDALTAARWDLHAGQGGNNLLLARKGSQSSEVLRKRDLPFSPGIFGRSAARGQVR